MAHRRAQIGSPARSRIEQVLALTLFVVVVPAEKCEMRGEARTASAGVLVDFSEHWDHSVRHQFDQISPRQNAHPDVRVVE